MKCAPTLKHNGRKSQTDAEQFYQIPQALADIVFSSLGNASAQLRIMMVLIGTKQGFNISQEWILKRTGLCERSYQEARKALVKRGWLSHSDGESITVNFNNIYEQKKPATIAEEKPAIIAGKDIPETIAGNGRKSATIAGEKPAVISGNTPAIIADITYKETDKKIKNNQEEKVVSQSALNTLLAGGNQIQWIDKDAGLFLFNGQRFRVGRIRNPAGEDPTNQSENTAKKQMPLNGATMAF